MEKLPGKVAEPTMTGTELTRKGSVEGRAVDNTFLDTGCSRMLMHQEWVPTDLEAVRRAADGHPCSAGVGFFRRDGLLYRLWTPPGREEEITTEQLVLPMQCRKAVLKVAHDIPLLGHLGKGKTAQRILQDFIGPNCTGMSQSIAALVKCARRHHNAAQESATVTLASGLGAFWPNCHRHCGTIAQTPFRKEVCAGHL